MDIGSISNLQLNLLSTFVLILVKLIPGFITDGLGVYCFSTIVVKNEITNGSRFKSTIADISPLNAIPVDTS